MFPLKQAAFVRWERHLKITKMKLNEKMGRSDLDSLIGNYLYYKIQNG
jgi:hypothetical protein